MPHVILQFLHGERDRHAAIFPAAGDDMISGSMPLRSMDDFDLFRSDTSLSSIGRRILVVESRAEAVALYRSMREDIHDGVVTQIGEEAWALSVSDGNGSYDSGIPVIEDLREGGEALTIEGDWVKVHIVTGEPTEFVEKSDDNEPDGP